jgi:DNA (cytosine-5)-methyltransferase 1
MGGNRTPIVDEDYVYDGSNNWIEEYHHHLMTGGIPKEGVAPKRLRRLTVDEAAQIQTYPEDYIFVGSQSSVFKQIGNAVPCNLAEATGKTVFDILDKLENSPKELPYVSF